MAILTHLDSGDEGLGGKGVDISPLTLDGVSCQAPCPSYISVKSFNSVLEINLYENNRVKHNDKQEFSLFLT